MEQPEYFKGLTNRDYVLLHNHLTTPVVMMT